MKFIIRSTLALVVLCFACAEIKSPHSISNDLPTTTATEIIQEATESSIEIEENVSAKNGKQTEAETTSSKENPVVEIATEQEQAATVQSESIPEETTHAKTGGGSEIPTVIEHAKTGYDDDEPEPVPQPIPEAGEAADLQVAMDAACAYLQKYRHGVDAVLQYLQRVVCCDNQQEGSFCLGNESSKREAHKFQCSLWLCTR